MTLADHPGAPLSPDAIALNLTAADKRQALALVAEIAGRAFDLPAAKVLDRLLEREAVASTGVGHGVAIPHVEIFGLDRTHGIFVRLRPPVAFGSLDDEPVDLVFALFTPPDRGSDHLRALARVARSLRSAELRQRLRQAASADSIRALLTRDARPDAA